jgi:3-methyladenine DNA glycosylase AlkD
MRDNGKDFDGIHKAIVRELRQHIEPEYRKGAQKYIKEGIVLFGVRLNIVRRISAAYFRQIKASGRGVIFSFCTELLKSKYAEEKTVAFDWAYRLRKQYKPEDFKIFESWLKKYVSNWGLCDDLCRHAFGAFVDQFSQFLRDVTKWTESENRWVRRSAAVIMIYLLRKGKHLDVAIRIADALLLDDDYLVQNGYGWMLKDASILFPEQVFSYVMRNKKKMPRRALRYAVERFTAQQRREAMA